MSQGQTAIAELRRRVGKVDPVNGFRIIDAMISEREQAVAFFEDLACCMAFDQGRLAECFMRREFMAVDDLLAIDTPWVTVHAETAPTPPPPSGLLGPGGNLLLGPGGSLIQ